MVEQLCECNDEDMGYGGTFCAVRLNYVAWAISSTKTFSLAVYDASVARSIGF